MKIFLKFKKKLSSFNSQLSSFNGFTLIELLIVIAVIGILATLILASSTNPTQKGRDTKRKSDLKQMSAALEMYKNDNVSSTYPNSITCGSALVINSVTYMKKIPCDPLNSGQNTYAYTPGSSNKSYTLKACLENPNDVQGVTSATCTESGKEFTIEPQ